MTSLPRALHRSAFFVFFLLSGFCGLLYEIVWTRLAMARFGVTTAVISVVLSVFMAGLAVGSWLTGDKRLLAWLDNGRRFLRAYAVIEIGIGTGAFLVPLLLDAGRAVLLRLAQTGSASYYLFSALFITIALVPFATLMGATFAMAMGALRRVTPRGESEHAFSFLYLANVLGAAAGTALSALALIEIYGFHGTLWVGALANVAIGIGAWLLSRSPAFGVAADSGANGEDRETVGAATRAVATWAADRSLGALVVLFATGFASMAMEVIWTRMFTIYISTVVYAFAALLTVYLLATYAGAYAYRWRVANGVATDGDYVWVFLGLLSVLPLVYADGRYLPHRGDFEEAPYLVLAIAPFCMALGYVTPLLIDRYGGRDVGRASRAYSVNVLGCILGPLAAGYLLLPLLGERAGLLTLAAGLLGIGAWAVWNLWRRRAAARFGVSAAFAANLILMWALGWHSQTYVEAITDGIVKRDPTATVVVSGSGMSKQLLVNGVGITFLTTITKMMAHFPLSHLTNPPRSALAICFGMGTTFRSLASWGIDTTAVDLVPSVPANFNYFHSDAAAVLSAGNARVVIDDGRRFLDRTDKKFDLITVDPPPPFQAAASSLLYSREFYQSVKRRLAPGGIFAQWTYRMEPTLLAPVARAILAEFKYVRVFGPVNGEGAHFLASQEPIPQRTAAELETRMPPKARADINEWESGSPPSAIFQRMLSREGNPRAMTKSKVLVPTLTDDRPANEYFAVRHFRDNVP
jgi:spermidine synthase